jgi:hypothetical protein
MENEKLPKVMGWMPTEKEMREARSRRNNMKE